MIRWKGVVGLALLLIPVVLVSCVHVSEHPQAEEIAQAEEEPQKESIQTDAIERDLEYAPFYSSAEEVHAWEIDRGSLLYDIQLYDSGSMYMYERTSSESFPGSQIAVMYVLFSEESLDLGVMFVLLGIEGSRAYSRVVSHYLSMIGSPANEDRGSLNWKLPSGITVSVADQSFVAQFGFSEAAGNATVVGFSILPISIFDFMQ